MAEEKSAPKKEKPAKPAAEGAPAAAPAEKKAKAPKGDKAAKPAADGSAPAAPAAGEAAPKAAAPADKPVEMVGGVAKQPTALRWQYSVRRRKVHWSMRERVMLWCTKGRTSPARPPFVHLPPPRHRAR